MDGSIPIGQVAYEISEAQVQINRILLKLYQRVGIVEIRTLVRYPEYSKTKSAKQPIVQLYKTVEGATAHVDYKDCCD